MTGRTSNSQQFGTSVIDGPNRRRAERRSQVNTDPNAWLGISRALLRFILRGIYGILCTRRGRGSAGRVRHGPLLCGVKAMRLTVLHATTNRRNNNPMKLDLPASRPRAWKQVAKRNKLGRIHPWRADVQSDQRCILPK